MRVRRFGAHIAAGPRGYAVIDIPFDPGEAWGVKVRRRDQATAPAVGPPATRSTPRRSRETAQHRLSRTAGHLAGYGTLLGYIWYRGRADKRSAA